MLSVNEIAEQLKSRYGEPRLPPARGPFELVLWENACYLLPDERREAVFETLRQKVGLTAEALWQASDEVLLPIARLGGMRPDVRVLRWRQIAEIVRTKFPDGLDVVLQLRHEKALKALQLFPSVGAPGAEKILMLCGRSAGLPLESNGLRVLQRIGYGREQKNYAAAYRSVQEDIRDQVPEQAKAASRIHLLLREHGKTLCKANRPLCEGCPLQPGCNFVCNPR